MSNEQKWNLVNEVEEVFKQFDVNGDGSLDEKEVHAFLDACLKKTGQTQVSANDFKEWVTKADRNSDGKISRAELFKILRTLLDKPK